MLIMPIWLVLKRVNQTDPFGPAASPSTPGLLAPSNGISAMCPLTGLITPNWSAVSSKNQ